MSTANVETFLVRLYTDREFLEQFLSTPENMIAGNLFSELEKASLLAIDKSDLIMAANSFNNKRQNYRKIGKP